MLLWLEFLAETFNETLVFIFTIMTGIALVGWKSGSFAVGLIGAFLIFFYITISIGDSLLVRFLYVFMGVILLYIARQGANLFYGENSTTG